MDKFVVFLFGLLLVGLANAELFKCTVNGKTIFSDKPCADNAEKIELKVYKPKKEDIEKQQQTTQQFEDSARVNNIEK